MFVVTLNKASLKKFGIGAMCCALVAFSALLGRYISTRTVSVSASVNKIESAQDIQTWFTGYGLDVDGASITADKVKIPRKWDDSFSAFNGVVQQSGLDLARYKGKTVEKWTALIPAASKGDLSQYGVLLVYRKKAIGAYLLEKPSGTVTGPKLRCAVTPCSHCTRRSWPCRRSVQRVAGTWAPHSARVSVTASGAS